MAAAPKLHLPLAKLSPPPPPPQAITHSLDSDDASLAASFPTLIEPGVTARLAAMAPYGVIALHHDTTANGVAVVADIIASVRAAGYTFVTLDECLFGSPLPGNNTSHAIGYA